MTTQRIETSEHVKAWTWISVYGGARRCPDGPLHMPIIRQNNTVACDRCDSLLKMVETEDASKEDLVNMASATITLDASNYIEGYRDGWLAALETIVELVKNSPNGQINWGAVEERLPELASKFLEETDVILTETHTVTV